MVLKVTVQKESPIQLLPKITSEAAVHRCSSKQVFLEILLYSQEKICDGVSFQQSCKSCGLQLYLKETSAQVFSYEYFEIFTNSFFCKKPPVAAFVQ